MVSWGPMSDLFLDLRDRARTADFLQAYAHWTEGADRTAAEKLLEDWQSTGKTPSTKLADMARKLARAVWPQRQALHRWLREGAGAQAQWDGVLKAVRPSTAHLLKRLAMGLNGANLADILAHPDADQALRDEERQEIALVQAQVDEALWHAHKDALAGAATDAKRAMKTYLERLSELRDLAVNMPEPFQGEIFSKLERYEDRMLFEGEALPLEVLDDEIRYYRDQKEVAPSDDMGTV